MVGDPTRLIARAAANGGHGNGRPTQDSALKGKPETGCLAGGLNNDRSILSGCRFPIGALSLAKRYP